MPRMKVLADLVGDSAGIRSVREMVARLLARQQEVRRSRLALVLAGHGQIVGIAGDAGIGKSRLIFELRQALGAHDVTYLEAHCHAHGPEMPYLPVLELVWAMCGISDFDTPEAMQAKVEAALNGLGLDASASSPYVLHLLGVKAGTAPIADLQPNTIKPRLLEILRQMVLRRSHRPARRDGSRPPGCREAVAYVLPSSARLI